MAHITDDRVLESTTTTGTGARTLAGALTGNKTVSGARRQDGTSIQVGDTMWGAQWAVDANGNSTGDYEAGLFTYSAANQVTLTTPLSTSNANAAVTWAAGTKYFAVASLSARTLQMDANLVVELPLASGLTVPSAGRMGLMGRSVAGRSMLAIVGPSGLDTALQPHLGRNKVAMWNPAGNSTTITAIGAAALSATGTATAANIAATNRHTRQKRLEYLVTTAATTAVAGFRSTAAQWSVGAATDGDGGFHTIFRWGPATGVATATNRCFVGMANTTSAPTDVNPSTITNIIGMGWDAADTNIQLMYRGAGAVTKVDLGASFPRPTADRTGSYEVALFSPPGTTQSVGYEITDNVTNAKATGTITTNLPTNSTFLAPRGWISAGGTSSVIGIALMGGYVESDY